MEAGNVTVLAKEEPYITPSSKSEKDKVTKKGEVKLSISTIATPCKMWYHVSIQVDYAYSTK